MGLKSCYSTTRSGSGTVCIMAHSIYTDTYTVVLAYRDGLLMLELTALFLEENWSCTIGIR